MFQATEMKTKKNNNRIFAKTSKSRIFRVECRQTKPFPFSISIRFGCLEFQVLWMFEWVSGCCFWCALFRLVVCTAFFRLQNDTASVHLQLSGKSMNVIRCKPMHFVFHRYPVIIYCVDILYGFGFHPFCHVHKAKTTHTHRNRNTPKMKRARGLLIP